MYWLGTISGASGAYSNQQTGASGLGYFAIPQSVKSLYLVPSASGISLELLNATGSTGSTFQTAAGRCAQLTPNTINGPFRTIGGPHHVVSVYYTGTGFVSVRVFAGPTS